MIINLFDKLFSFFGLLILSPLLIVLTLAVKLSSKGPIFFKQVRVGKDLKTFKIFKFRSMTHDKNRFSGEISANLSKEEMQKLRGNFITTCTKDARITKIGAFIRKTSLDELPQILNVLFNDMSLVGPRPDTPIQEVDYTSEQWRMRHRIKPGITGLAQINGRSFINAEDRINADIKYCDEKSLKLYFKILFLTFYQVMAGKASN